MAALGEGTWVRAGRDFGYDDRLGPVKLGQVFQLGGHINDDGLERHAFFTVLDPQPKAKEIEALPQCGACGRRFTEEWERNLCGQSHEIDAGLTEAEKITARHEKAAQRVDAVREITVGK